MDEEMKRPDKEQPSVEPRAGGGKDVPAASTAPPPPDAVGTSGDGKQGGEQFYDQLLKLKAEFENYRKRIDRDRPEWIRMGEARLWERLLPVYDALLKAHALVLRGPADDGAAAKELIQGLELVFKEFTRIFESEGIKAIATVGQPYHHDLHEVLGTVETQEHPDGWVVEELQPGYTLQGKVLRPARVRIAKAKQDK